MNYPQRVTIVEVGPRDGLQNETQFVSTADKIELINLLSSSGLTHIEATSFVSPQAIPQLADNEEVMKAINKPASVHFSALVPNERGMRKAIEAGFKEIAVFTAASESFNQRNIHCSIAGSLLRFKPVFALAKANQMKVRAYISCALGCPYEGTISIEQVSKVAEQLLDLGADELCLGDTIGVGTPKKTQALIKDILTLLPASQLSMHFHDTYGQALANILGSLQLGINRFDSAVAGLGGCPYAAGASGNVATEDVLYMMQGLGIETGVDLGKIIEAGEMICKILGKKTQSKVAKALLAKDML